MNKWLKFSCSTLESNYQKYINKNEAKNYRILFFIAMCYSFINSFSIIIEYFYSDIPKFTSEEWLIKRLFIVIICCILLAILLLINRKCKLFTLKHYEISKLFIAIILQAILDDEILQIHEFSAGVGYEYFWEGYQIQFYSLFLCLIFKRWTYRILYFYSSSLYHGLLKIETIHDRIQNIRQAGLCMFFGCIVYCIEKTSRENFLEFQIIIQKETAWKRSLENIPEDILIINSLKHIKYRNNSSKKQNIEKTDNHANGIQKYEKDDFLERITNLTLKESKIDLKLRFQKSLSVNYQVIENKPTIEKNLLSLQSDAIFPKKSLLSDANEQTFSLSEIFLYLNNNSDCIVDDEIPLIFDGILDGTSVELKVLSVLYENQKCLMVIIFDTIQSTQQQIITKLEENDRHKNNILATVSHELRNPLNSSMSMLQLAVKENSIPSKYREELLEPCLRSLGMLANLINDILDYSQIQANKLKLVFQYVDLRQLVYDACLLIDTQCKRKGLKLRVNIDTEIPEMLKTDPNRLTQVLLNLLSNALKFTLQGYIKIFLKLKDNDKNQVTITVKDTGIGINPDDIPKLFQEYGKLDLGNNVKLNPTGCGLGLNISQNLAKRLGNEESNDCGIKVESILGKETSFSFTIQHKGQINSKKDISPPRSRKQTEDYFADICTTAPQSNISYLKAPNPRQRKNNINLLSRYKSQNIIEEDFQIELEEGDKADPNKYIENNYIENFMKTNKCFDYDSPKLTYGSSQRLLSDGETDNNEGFKEQKHFREKNIRILLVYDKYFSLTTQKKIWDEIGYYCNFTFLDDDIKEKFKEMGEQKVLYNLIIVDANITIENASLIIQMLKEEMSKNNLQSPLVIGCTENLNIDLRLRYKNIGIQDIIKKPLTKDKLNIFIKN